MIDRINRYYQAPASKALVNHFRDDIGFVGVYKQIFDDLRECSGDTQLHADNVGVSVKQYNQMAAIVGGHCVAELIRLAEKGLEAERKSSE